jgi:hypothetical protein
LFVEKAGDFIIQLHDRTTILDEVMVTFNFEIKASSPQAFIIPPSKTKDTKATINATIGRGSYLGLGFPFEDSLLKMVNIITTTGQWDIEIGNFASIAAMKFMITRPSVHDYK